MNAGYVVLAASLAAGACSAPLREADFVLPPYAEKGCWARFYEQADFGEPMRQIEGPTFVEAIPGGVIKVPDQETAGVQPLFVEARSLQVGPHARVLGYRETLFRGEATVLAPGTVVRDAAAIGYPQRFASLKLQCEA